MTKASTGYCLPLTWYAVMRGIDVKNINHDKGPLHTGYHLVFAAHPCISEYDVYATDKSDSKTALVNDHDNFTTEPRGPNPIYFRVVVRYVARRTTIGNPEITATTKVSARNDYVLDQIISMGLIWRCVLRDLSLVCGGAPLIRRYGWSMWFGRGRDLLRW